VATFGLTLGCHVASLQDAMPAVVFGEIGGYTFGRKPYLKHLRKSATSVDKKTLIK